MIIEMLHSRQIFSRLTMDFIEDLKTLGYFCQSTNEKQIKKLISGKNKICAYIGFDCTAKSLHIGSMMQIMILRLLQKKGHKPIVLLGGTTTKVGDPTGKDSMRKMLSDDEIAKNKAGIKKTLEKFIKFGRGDSDAMILDNSKWLENFNYIDFLQKFGRHISVNKMLSMEAAKQRLDRQSHLSFLEFNYMLFQAIDFFHLYKEHNCILQIGGSDQWGNIIMGVELVHKLLGKEAFGVTTHLVTNSSGQKMGKTEKGAVWLDGEMLSPYDFFQFWRNIDDPDVVKFGRYFGEFSEEEYNKFQKLINDNINQAKKDLAYRITELVHGKVLALEAVKTAEAIFEQGITNSTMPQIEINKNLREEGIEAFKLFTLSGISESNKKSKDLIRAKGAKLNGKLVEDENMLIDSSCLNINNSLTIAAGKKKHLMIKFTL